VDPATRANVNPVSKPSSKRHTVLRSSPPRAEPGHTLAYAVPQRVRPNPSLKQSANGMSRWPSSAGPAAHFALAVQHAMPLSPA
jgi:hypothetical protein